MRLFLAFLVLFLVQPLQTEAQFSGNTALDTELALEQQPSYPSPGESVTISLNDYQGSMFGAEVQWFINNEPLPDAKNQRQITTTAGNAGSVTIVSATLTLPGGVRKMLETRIEPAYLDIIVEPQTHVPDFYAGRALPSIGSVVNLTALIDGKVRNDLIYTWRINDEVLEGGPLRGGSRVAFTTPQGTTVVVSLQVSRLDGSVLARRAVSIPSVLPELHFYEVNTPYGMSRRPITSAFNLIGNSSTIKAEPYFLDSRVFNNPDIRTWSINGIDSPDTGNNPYEVTLERTGFSGATTLGFHVRSTDSVLQGARNEIDINF